MREIDELLRLGGRRDHEVDGEVATPGRAPMSFTLARC